MVPNNHGILNIHVALPKKELFLFFLQTNSLIYLDLILIYLDLIARYKVSSNRASMKLLHLCFSVKIVSGNRDSLELKYLPIANI